MLNSESIVIIRIKGEHLLYSKISGGMIGYGWGNVCYIVIFSPGEYLLYSKVSEGKVYYIANIPRGNVYYIVVNIPGEGLLCGRFTIRHRDRRDHHWMISRVLVDLSLFFCLVLCGSLLELLAFSFGHCIVCPSSIYDLCCHPQIFYVMYY